ncbi:hypothetical protein QBC33DRAFT_538044 [Phialemonium atrogriseum]|uniref:Uncharacterized protein n=1 Tax=Phialemonium atrogriseum TaxID=1093897 RepID=A0AAJ0C1F2_9PEZI|nr:uncharacterized protein QBC33DRAFT_538044 [Phialemonium atrogriseum]KAK1767343.1 hypothetical protein QBC33DRAFT_538044 [Phialemonium atrogriseum]
MASIIIYFCRLSLLPPPLSSGSPIDDPIYERLHDGASLGEPSPPSQERNEEINGDLPPLLVHRPAESQGRRPRASGLICVVFASGNYMSQAITVENTSRRSKLHCAEPRPGTSRTGSVGPLSGIGACRSPPPLAMGAIPYAGR